jgi:hypothetical protein
MSNQRDISKELASKGFVLPSSASLGQVGTSLKIDNNRINCYDNKKTSMGDKCYPRTQFSCEGFENGQVFIIFNTPVKGDRVKGDKNGKLMEDANPDWVNTQTLGVKMDPNHEQNADMYKIGISVGDFMRGDTFRREFGKKNYTKTKPGDPGVVMYDSGGQECVDGKCAGSPLVIPRGQKFAVVLRYWNIDTKGKDAPNGVHIEAYVDPTNNGSWQKYLEVDDIGQIGGGKPLIRPKFQQRVQTRLDEAKPHWEQNIELSQIVPISFESKDYVTWISKTLKVGN